jgi:hypothetical protein
MHLAPADRPPAAGKGIRKKLYSPENKPAPSRSVVDGIGHALSEDEIDIITQESL